MERSFDREVDAPRSATSREWEVFVREAATEPPVHAGSVSAPSEGVAREQATELLGWAGEALWLCPADEVCRLQTDELSLVPDESGEPETEAGEP
jgi:rSAM-partnered protein